jgi:putative transposase
MSSHSLTERRKMVCVSDPLLSISQQCNLLSIHRSGLYYQPVAESEENLLFMRLIDEQYLSTPFYGFRKMTQYLLSLGHQVNRKRVRRLMRLMGLMAIYQKPNTSQANKLHYKYPYLLKGLTITRSNQVWAADITYIPMKRGFMYLMAIIDLHSRYVIGWSVSNSMEADWCANVVEQAIARHGKPEIFNTDQGSQFTSEVFIKTLKDKQISISMDGKGRALNNIFIERLWRSVKYENIYLNAYGDGTALYQGLKTYFAFYNQERFHQSLAYQTPNSLYQMAA